VLVEQGECSLLIGVELGGDRGAGSLGAVLDRCEGFHGEAADQGGDGFAAEALVEVVDDTADG